MHWLEVGAIVFWGWLTIAPSAIETLSPVLYSGYMTAYTVWAIKTLPPDYIRKTGKIIIVVLCVTLLYYLLNTTHTIDTSVQNYELKRFISRFNQTAAMAFPMLFFVRLQLFANQLKKMIVLFSILGICCYVAFNTYTALSLNERIARSFAENLERTEGDIGSYSFVYTMSILTTTAGVAFCMSKKLWFKIINVATIIVLYAFLLKAQYSLAVLIASITIALALFLNTRRAELKVLIIFCLLVSLWGVPDLLYYISRNVESGDISLRFSEVADMLSGKELGYNAGGRLQLYWDSIKFFFYSPIWGHADLPFNGHATLLTVFSYTGLLGGIPFCYILFALKKQVLQLLNFEDADKYFLPVFLSLILQGLTNPIDSVFSLYVVLWLLAPLLIELFASKNTINQGKKDGESYS